MTEWLTLDQSELEDATNVLLVAPEPSQSVESRFSELLTKFETTPERIVGVTTSKSPDDFLDVWRRTVPGEATSFSFVSTNGVARSVAVDAADGDSFATNADVEHVDDVTPVSKFGKIITDRLDDDGETVLCFHSLTDLLAYVDMEAAFHFLHVLLSRVRTSGARGIYHIDGTVHDEETIIQLSTLFDLVVEFDRNAAARHRDSETRGSR